MRQILFHVPVIGLPVYGYGAMLFLAFIFCQWLAKRLCKRQGVNADLIPDLTIWLFVSGIIGGRLVYVIETWQTTDKLPGFDRRPLWEVIKLWDGGLVLYGALFGGAVGYFAFDHFVMKKHGVSKWKMIDICAPCIALGIALGRIGCLCTGCCYGNVACDAGPAIHFPVFTNTEPTQYTSPGSDMIKRGYQTPLGFEDRGFGVEAVEPGSAAARAGLQPGDIIDSVNGKEAHKVKDVIPENGELALMVVRDGQEKKLPAFTPTTIGLHPTQIYETISMCLLLFFLLSYFPYKKRDGEVFVLLMFGYGIHRFLNEMLRLDNDPGLFGLTLSQNVSIAVLVAAIVFAVMVWRQRIETAPAVSPPPAQT